ncbi:MAG: hypothetical protein ACE5FW_01775 [Candidatus Aenigmatarchaeota archaeon]
MTNGNTIRDLRNRLSTLERENNGQYEVAEALTGKVEGLEESNDVQYELVEGMGQHQEALEKDVRVAKMRSRAAKRHARAATERSEKMLKGVVAGAVGLAALGALYVSDVFSKKPDAPVYRAPPAVVKQIKSYPFPANKRLEVYKTQERDIKGERGLMLYLERIPWSDEPRPGEDKPETHVFFVKNPTKRYRVGDLITVPLDEALGVEGSGYGDDLELWLVPEYAIKAAR